MQDQIKTQKTDILIVGGGLVGASLALALSRTSSATKQLQITLVESVDVSASTQPSFDDRSTVLSHSSSCLLEELGVWENLQQQAAPIKHIHTSEQGGFGFTRLHAVDYHLDAMGYVIENRALGQVLYRQLQKADNIDCLMPAKVTKLVPHAASYECHVHLNQSNVTKDGSSLDSIIRYSAKLVVLCDGGRSSLAQDIGLSETTAEYQQAALIANIALDRPHNGWAYERFTEQGPIALLPLNNYAEKASQYNKDVARAALVWTTPQAELEQRLALSDDDFLQQLQQAFGYRLGYFKQVGTKAFYPLKVQKVNELIRSRLAVLGNAAHTLHPVAGQGFNLALRGALLLARTVLDAHQQGKDIGTYSILKHYEQAQIIDRDRIQQASHNLIRIFANQACSVKTARNLAMLMLDHSPLLKSDFAHTAMGLDVAKKRFVSSESTIEFKAQ